MACWIVKDGKYRIDVNKLATHLKSRGLNVIIVTGAQSRGHGSFPGKPVTVLTHHTATADSIRGDYPSLRIVRDGRSDLPGPLAQFGLGRSGTVYIIASGLAWHAGKVGKTEWDNWRSVGIEAENSGTSSYSTDMYNDYVKLVAALAEPNGLDLKNVLGHKEAAVPKGRKPDPSFNMDTFRSKVTDQRRRWSGGTSGSFGSSTGTTAYAYPLPTGHWFGVDDGTQYSHSGVRSADKTHVVAIQKRLGITADGSFGPKTEYAVKRYQGSKFLAVDGKVGPRTWQSLAPRR